MTIHYLYNNFNDAVLIYNYPHRDSILIRDFEFFPAVDQYGITDWARESIPLGLKCSRAGANDLGGVLMDKLVTGAERWQPGQLFNAAQLCVVSIQAGRSIRKWNNFYGAEVSRQNHELGAFA